MIDFIFNVDKVVNNFFLQNITIDSFYYTFFKYFTELGNYQFIIIGSILFTVYNLYSENYHIFGIKTKHFLLPFWTSITISQTLTICLKYYFDRIGPAGRQMFDLAPSFTSGHSSIAVAFFGILAYLYLENREEKNLYVNKKLIIFSTVLIIFLIGFSRLVLDVHFLSDVLVGFLVGTFSVFVGIKVRNYLN